jgi:hypothetical protein
MSTEARQQPSWATRIAVLTSGKTVVNSVLVFSIGIAMCGHHLGADGGRTLFSPAVDVPGTVASYELVRKSAPKTSSWTEHRVTARYTWDGEERLATGDVMEAVSRGSPITVRVPVWRPSLALAFTGSEPAHTWNWLVFFVCAVGGASGLFAGLRKNLHHPVSRGPITWKDTLFGVCLFVVTLGSFAAGVVWSRLVFG